MLRDETALHILIWELSQTLKNRHVSPRP